MDEYIDSFVDKLFDDLQLFFIEETVKDYVNMARYLKDYPVGNGRFENVNPRPLAVGLKKATAPQLSIREQIRLEMELAKNDRELIDEDPEDFDMEDEYTIDFDEEDGLDFEDAEDEESPEPTSAPSDSDSQDVGQTPQSEANGGTGGDAPASS